MPPPPRPPCTASAVITTKFAPPNGPKNNVQVALILFVKHDSLHPIQQFISVMLGCVLWVETVLTADKSTNIN